MSRVLRPCQHIIGYFGYGSFQSVTCIDNEIRAPVSLAVLLGFTCLVACVYFVYFYEQIND